jgi:multifunctional 2-oxoglutarate metabolism enzyme
VVFTPKQLLRLKAATSPVEDFTSGTFRPVLGDTTVDPAGVDRVLLCTGRVYYDLAAERAKREDTRTAIVRLEQLYPFDDEAVAAELARYDGAEVVWVQDEPRNQGAWVYVAMTMQTRLREVLPGGRLRAVSRKAAAAPAAGTAKVSKAEQEALVAEAFAR